MTHDDDRSGRPQSGQRLEGSSPEAHPAASGQPDDDIGIDATAPDPDDLTTQVSFAPAADADADPDAEADNAAGFGDEEAFSPGGAAAETEPRPAAEPDGADGGAPAYHPAARSRRGRKPNVTGADPGLAIFVDSSAIVALVDRDDGAHAAAVAAYGNLLSQGYKLFTTNYVIAEAFDLLSTGVGPDVARRFLRDCKLAIYHADEQDERRAKRLVLRQTGPNGLTLTDAVSFVVMERLAVADAFAVDPGFLANAT